MSALICGSLAYDTIMVFPERFKDHILPDKVHMLNVSFLVPEMRRQYGGVAGLTSDAWSHWVSRPATSGTLKVNSHPRHSLQPT